MNDISAGDRVKCVDATPLPINVPDAVATDFSFPGGFIEEGRIYCVTQVSTNSRGGTSLRLLGYPVIHGPREIGWDGGLRFRGQAKTSEPLEERRSEEISAGLDAVTS